MGATTAASLPLWVGMDQGIFAKHNIDVQIIVVVRHQGPARACAARRILDLVSPTWRAPSWRARRSTIVGTTYPYQFFRLYGRKGMTSPSELKGGTIAASSAGSASYTAIQAAMGGTGLQRGRDYQVTYIGDNGARSAALQKGVVDAIVVSPPTAQLVEQQGFSDIADLISQKAPYGYSSFGVLKSWAQQNHGHLVDFLVAYGEAVNASKSDKQATFDAARKNLQLTDDAILQQVYDVSVAVMPAFPVTDPKTVASTIALSQNPAVVKADPASLVDNSFVQEAQQKSGGGA